MTERLNILIVAAAVFFVACGLHAAAPAQAAASGSYTDAQAVRGEEVYAEQCAACHGADLSGIADLFPALAGDVFVETWQERSIGELFEAVSVTMPALDPGSLTPAQSASVVAYMLSVSKYPSGSADLATDLVALNAIPIGAPE
jgi:mono/diheme cytochrome c family protein